MQSAIDLPRLFPLRASRRLECERRIVRDLGPQLVERGYELQPATRPIGGAQAIAIDWENGTLVGASDARKDGLALGY